MRARGWPGSCLLALAACFADAGRDETGTTADSTSTGEPATTGTTGPDAPAGPSLCGLPHGGWIVGPAERLAINTSADEIEPVLAPDGLTLFYSDGQASLRTTRAGPTGAFVGSAANADFGLDSVGRDTRVVLSPDQLTVHVTSDRSGTLGQLDIWRATRANLTDTFKGYENVGPLNSPLDDLDHQLSADGLRMYLASVTDADTRAQQLEVATRPRADGKFQAPIAIPELASDARDSNPTFPPDELTLIFASTRTGTGDLYVTVRPDTKSPFAAPTRLDAVNTLAYREAEPWLAADGCELFFASDRPGGAGGLDIYRAPIVAK